jgi:curli biogenesis system outer membrane secretion channel CsgG
MARSISINATRPATGWTRPIAAMLLAATSLVACVSPTPRADGTYAAPIGGAPVVNNETQYSNQLRCIGGLLRSRPTPPPRIAVGTIADYTGKYEADGSGRKVTQGANLMAMSALSKAGVRLVERFDTFVADLELKYANNNLVTDSTTPGYNADVRKILAGSIQGSDYYLIGGITELNFNIRSVAADAFAGATELSGLRGTAGAKLFVMNVAMDLRLINTQTLEVVKVISYQKQILGREISLGVFDFLGSTILDIGAGERALEPIQLAVRAVTERAILDIMKDMDPRAKAHCGIQLDSASDPLADRGEAASSPVSLPVPQPVRRVVQQPVPNDAYKSVKRPVQTARPQPVQSTRPAGSTLVLRSSIN